MIRSWFGGYDEVRGRCGRVQYWLWSLVGLLILAWIIVTAVSGVWGTPIIWIVIVLYAIFQRRATIQRLHDLNVPKNEVVMMLGFPSLTGNKLWQRTLFEKGVK